MKVGLLIILYMFMVNWMVFWDGWQDLDYLFRKVIRYQHHHDNYQESLEKNIILFGLRIKKPSAIKATLNNFYTMWNSVLYDNEKKLMEFLLAETEKTINILYLSTVACNSFLFDLVYQILLVVKLYSRKNCIYKSFHAILILLSYTYIYMYIYIIIIKI